MNRVWLLLDANFLAWRNFHALGELQSPEGVKQGVVYGLLRDVVNFQQLFGTKDVVFCWDGPESKRKEIYPGYKNNRAPPTPEDAELRAELHRQIDLVRHDYLPALGYANNFTAAGYEADDLVAALAQWITLRSCFPATRDETAVIISSDKDFCQCLTETVSIYNPKTRATTTIDSYMQKWGLTPDDWPHVLALAGDASDNIPGLAGVGYDTAARYVNGTLKPTGARYKSMASATGQKVWRRNLQLVTLPLAGCPRPELAADDVTPAKWTALERRLGFRGLGYK